MFMRDKFRFGSNVHNFIVLKYGQHTSKQAVLMHGHVSKCVNMHIKPMGGTNKHGKHIITQSGKAERYARSNQHHGDASQVIASK